MDAFAVLAAVFFFTCFLCFLAVVAVAVFAAGALPAGAGVCAANISGMEATARAIVNKLVFIFVFLLCGLVYRPLTFPS